eukprot:2528367-Rhodomonas_salina.2
MNPEPWTLDHEPWTLDPGPSSFDSGQSRRAERGKEGGGHSGARQRDARGFSSLQTSCSLHRTLSIMCDDDDDDDDGDDDGGDDDDPITRVCES